MNSLEKKSFYSFLGLYILSSLIFILVSAYWYYSAQKASLESNDYYTLQHRADTISREIITSYMQGKPLPTIPESKRDKVTLVNTKGEVVTRHALGVDSEGHITRTPSHYDITALHDGYSVTTHSSILISSAPQKHHNIAFVIIESYTLESALISLKAFVFATMVILFLLILVVAWVLSKIFMRPIHQKVKQIEQFIQDISHELNTPITALQMSSKRALQKKVYDEKILTNISISTKQLYTIYQSLIYLNFTSPEQKEQKVDLKPLLEESISFYSELSRAKHIEIVSELSSSHMTIVTERARLLFSNLISNAIKYSMPETTITIVLKEGFFSIKDEGVGIEEKKLREIFKPYERSSDIAGGFGVGLSIVAQICKEFDITIDVTSELGKGSCFTLKW